MLRCRLFHFAGMYGPSLSRMLSQNANCLPLFELLVARGKGICAITSLCRSIQLFVLFLINMGYEHLWRDRFSV